MNQTRNRNSLGLHQEPLEDRILLSASLIQPATSSLAVDLATPKVARPIESSASQEVRGKSTNLSVIGSDDQSTSQLIYTWTAESRPTDSSPTFVQNGTNRAKSTQVRFDRAGEYTFRVDIRDLDGNTVSDRIQIRVVQVLSGISINGLDTEASQGSKWNVARKNTLAFEVRAKDQFGDRMEGIPKVDWKLDSLSTEAKPSLQETGQSSIITLDRAGKYRLRASADKFTAGVLFESVPTLTRLQISSNGTSVSQGSTLRAVSPENIYSVTGFDQFGNRWSRPLSPEWSIVSRVKGGPGSQIQTDGVQANVVFAANGTHQVTVKADHLQGSFNVNVGNAKVPPSSPENTKEIRVSNRTELRQALSGAKGGETILLQGGVGFGGLNLYNPRQRFESMVTLKSADPYSPAVFDSINLVGVQNLTIENVQVINRNRSVAISISNSEKIHVRDSRISSELDPYRAGQTLRRGVDLRGSKEIGFENNQLERLGTAFGVLGSSQVIIEGNTFRENLLDNLNLGSNISDIIVQGNTFYAQLAKLDPEHHYDNIQLWVQTDATQHSRNIKITGNTIFDLTGNVKPQAIFGRGDYVDDNGVPNPWGFENVEISHNVIVTQHANAISMTDTKGLRISNNTLIYAGNPEETFSSVNIPGIRATLSQDVLIENNIIPRKQGYPNSNTSIFRNNTLYEVESGVLSDFLTNPFAANPTREDFAVIREKRVQNTDGSLRGAEVERVQTDRPTAVFRMDRTLRNGKFSYSFDASESMPAIGTDLNGAKYQWRFSDGTEVHGVKVEKQFEYAGPQDVSLTVTDRFGQTNTFVKERVIIRDSNAISLDFNGAISDNSSTKSVIKTTGTATLTPQVVGGNAVQLGGDDGHLYIDSTDPDLSEASSTRQLTIQARIQAKASENTAALPLATRHGIWSLQLQPTGGVQFTIAGQKYAFKPSVPLLDGKWHEVAFSVNENQFSFFVDGKKAHASTMTQTQAAAFFQEGGYGIGIGGSGPWIANRVGTKFQLDDLQIRTNSLDVSPSGLSSTKAVLV